jgi:hypothetical protein
LSHDTPNPPEREQNPLVREGFRLLRQGRIEQAQAAFEEVLAGDAEEIEAMNGLGVVSVLKQDTEQALIWFNRAARLAPEHPEILNNLVDVLLERSFALVRDDRLDEAAALDLQALKLVGALSSAKPRLSVAFAHLSDRFHRAGRLDDAIRMAEAAARLTPGRPSVHNYLHLLRAARCNAENGRGDSIDASSLGTHVLVTGFPESGIEVLVETLSGNVGLVDTGLSDLPFRTEGPLSESRLWSVAALNTVSQLHCAPTEENLRLMHRFGIRLVIVVRDICEALRRWRRSTFAGVHFLPTAFGRGSSGAGPVVRQIDIILAEKAAGLIKFYAEWRRATDRRAIDALWLTSEEALADPRGAAGKIARFLGLTSHETSIAAALRRFSRAPTDPSLAEDKLTAEQKAVVRGLTRSYPDIDFSAIGL